MLKNKTKSDSGVKGFTLAESLAALAIAVMVMAAVVGVYTTIRNAQVSIDTRLKKSFSATEVLQRIAEDLDRLALSGSDITMSINNKVDTDDFIISQMIIESKIYDKDSQAQTFEKIVWQSKVSVDGNDLIIYRAHSGYTIEDKMLDEPKEKSERELYVPVCSGVTYFVMQASDGNDASDANAVTEDWTSTTLPQAVRISISSEPRELDNLGGLSVPEDLIRTRIVAVNRFRQIPYSFVYKDYDPNDDNDVNDVNLPDDSNDSTDTNSR